VKSKEFLFCPQCGLNIEKIYLATTVIFGNDSLSERDIIESYFQSGFEYESILQFLSKFHAIKMSMSTLKRRLKMFGLQRFASKYGRSNRNYEEGVKRIFIRLPDNVAYHYTLNMAYWFLET
jgi:hypothetical protein